MKKVLISLLASSLMLLLVTGCESEQTDADQAETEASAEAEEAEEADQDDSAEADEQDEEADQEEAGQWVESSSYELKFRVPDDWEVVEGEEGVSATDAEGAVTVLLAGSKSDRMAKSMLNELRADLKFKDVEVEKTGPTTINGVPVFHGQGTAVLEKEEIDQEIQFVGYTIKRDSDEMATLFIFADAGMYEAKKDEISGIANTLVETAD
jgi:hypothetical protein